MNNELPDLTSTECPFLGSIPESHINVDVFKPTWNLLIDLGTQASFLEQSARKQDGLDFGCEGTILWKALENFADDVDLAVQFSVMSTFRR